MNTKDIKQQIDELSRTLHLPAFRREYEQQSSQAVAESLSYEAFLLRLMELESQTREENRRKSQVRQAGFVQYTCTTSLVRICRRMLPQNFRNSKSLILSGAVRTLSSPEIQEPGKPIWQQRWV